MESTGMNRLPEFAWPLIPVNDLEETHPPIVAGGMRPLPHSVPNGQTPVAHFAQRTLIERAAGVLAL
jgi:hypothetical protein